MATVTHPNTVVLSVEAGNLAFDQVTRGAGAQHEQARLLIWKGDAPAGVLDVRLPLSDPAEFADRVASVGPARPPGRLDAIPTGSATVVVATYNRPDTVVRCVRSLLSADGQGFSVIVVDNAPNSDRAFKALQEHFSGSSRVRYVAAEQPGLAAAHNAALAHVETDLVLFTDDDVVVDRRWVKSMVAAFESDPAVACVTGLIMPAELETETQWLIEDAVGFAKGFDRRVFDRDQHRPDDPLFPLTAGSFGSGANMAFRTAYLREAGGFDEALGAGSLGGGGDDLAAFIDVVQTGRRLVYEPSAVVFHPHHRLPAAARTMAYGYGKGLTAAMISSLVSHPRLLRVLLWHLPRAVAHAVSPNSSKNRHRPNDYPPKLARTELAGMATGPFAYVASRMSVWRHRRRAAPAPSLRSLLDDRTP